jgi:hypothetical protein
MKRRFLAVLVLPALLLAGCASGSQLVVSPGASGSSVAPSVAPSVTPIATPSITPVVTPPPVAVKKPAITHVIPASYLVEGKPHQPDSNGDWMGRWAFYTDSTKDVFCDIYVFSGDPAGVHCYITSHALNAQVSWSAPASVSAECGATGSYGVGLNVESLYPKTAGFMGCFPFIDQATASIQAKTKVLPDKAVLVVSPFSCTVKSGAVTCHSIAADGGGGALSFGLHSLAFVQ